MAKIWSFLKKSREELTKDIFCPETFFLGTTLILVCGLLFATALVFGMITGNYVALYLAM